MEAYETAGMAGAAAVGHVPRRMLVASPRQPRPPPPPQATAPMRTPPLSSTPRELSRGGPAPPSSTASMTAPFGRSLSITPSEVGEYSGLLPHEVLGLPPLHARTKALAEKAMQLRRASSSAASSGGPPPLRHAGPRSSEFADIDALLDEIEATAAERSPQRTGPASPHIAPSSGAPPLSSGTAGLAASVRGAGSQQELAGWRCGQCAYHCIALDHRGVPLPLGTDAWGRPIPARCPRCAATHSDWAPAPLFDEAGDHANLASRTVNRVRHGARRVVPPSESIFSFGGLPFAGTSPSRPAEVPATPPPGVLKKRSAYGSSRHMTRSVNGAPLMAQSPADEAFESEIVFDTPQHAQEYEAERSRHGHPSGAANDVLGRRTIFAPLPGPLQKLAALTPRPQGGKGGASPKGAGVGGRSGSQCERPKRWTYRCGHCSRPMLRMDAFGHLLPLDRGPTGDLLAVRCPGCGAEHTDWAAVPLYPSAQAPSSASVSRSQSAAA